MHYKFTRAKEEIDVAFSRVLLLRATVYDMNPPKRRYGEADIVVIFRITRHIPIGKLTEKHLSLPSHTFSYRLTAKEVFQLKQLYYYDRESIFFFEPSSPYLKQA